MAAFDELYREMKTLPGHAISRDELKQALRTTALGVVKANAILQKGKEYWLSLDGILWLMLKSYRNRDATAKQRRIGFLIQRAIDETKRIQ